MSRIAQRGFRSLALKSKSPLDAKDARRYTLENGNELIIHSPASSVPVDIPYPSQVQSLSNTERQSAHPPAFLTQSPLDMRTPAKIPSSILFPRTGTSFSGKKLSLEEISQIQAKRSNSSLTQLANQFSVTRNTIARFGFRAGKEGKDAKRLMLAREELKEERKRSRWGIHKT